MAKELKSAATNFELTEAFWKLYKPDSVKETGLSGKLRDYEKKLKEAKKLDGAPGSPVAKANKWGEVRAALHDLTEAMAPVINALGKDKDSHKNLKASLTRVHKELKAKTHPAYQTAEENMALPTDEEEVGGAEWDKWVAKIPDGDIRTWGTVLREYQDLSDGMPADRELEAALGEARKTSRKAYLKKMTGPRSFDNDVTRLAESFDAYHDVVAKYIRNSVDALNQRNTTGQLNPWITELKRILKLEANFWRTLQSAKKPG